MADVDTSQGGGRSKKGGPKTNKKSTRVDMTAMVDVAFLLLTFFVLTATMADNAVMELTMPPKTDEEEDDDKYKKIIEDKIMTIVLDEDDKVKYFVGITDPDVLTTDFDPGKGVREAIKEHVYGQQKALGVPLCKDVNNVGLAEGKCWDPIFVIKPKKESRYKNLVDLLDELAIMKAPKFAIDKYSDADSVVIATSEERMAAEAAGEAG